MAVYFFDSSALVKRYANETGTAWVTTLVANNYVFLARVTIVEVIAAIERRKRTGTITLADAAAAISSFRADLVTDYALMDISRTLIAEAANLAELHGLRGYDAVQLAGALYLHRERQGFNLSPMVLVSADKELNAAATAEGLTVENPNNH